MTVEPIEEIRKIAEQALRDAIGHIGLDRVLVESGFDHDGEPALFIDAILTPKTPLLSGATANSALWSLRSALTNRGDLRFPYLKFKHPDDEYPNDNFTTDRVNDKAAS
jgi:hypothetical protein